MRAWLSVWREVQMCCVWSSWWQYHLIISCFTKTKNGLPFWSQFAQVVREKRPWNECCCSRPCVQYAVNDFQKKLSVVSTPAIYGMDLTVTQSMWSTGRRQKLLKCSRQCQNSTINSCWKVASLTWKPKETSSWYQRYTAVHCTSSSVWIKLSQLLLLKKGVLLTPVFR